MLSGLFLKNNSRRLPKNVKSLKRHQYPGIWNSSNSPHTAKKCLQKAGLTVGDIDLWEINEAFASVALRYMKDLGISHEITNVVGGAIAMGHPLGATGGCLVSAMLDELERRNMKRAMLSLCVGGGMGISTIIERV